MQIVGFNQIKLDQLIVGFEVQRLSESYSSSNDIASHFNFLNECAVTYLI